MELISISDNTINGQAVQTVNARDLHAFLEIKQDFSTWIKARIEQYGFVEGVDYLVHKIMDNPLGGRPTLDYYISIDMAKELSMVERNEKGKQARLYFLECERHAKSAAPAYMIPQSLHEALRLAADLAEQRVIAEQQRDEAIRTKALIGSKREATAMATASKALKRAMNLEIELDRSKQYASVKRMQKLYRGSTFDWRVLKAVSIRLGLSPVSIHDANYTTVKAYHADVWRAAYALQIES